jgi:hypothetical protein
MKFTKEQTLSFAGKIHNEDAATFNNKSAWVLDGATGLGKNIISKTSDASWYSQQWDRYLKNNINDTSKTLNEIFKTGMTQIKKEYDKLSSNQKVDNIDMPSAGIALIRQNNKRIEYFLLGDCMLSIKFVNQISHFKMQELDKLDKISIKQMIKTYNEGGYKNLVDTRQDKSVQSILTKNRLLKNTKNGYWVLGFEKQAIDNALTGFIENNNYEILLMSDGFYAIKDKYQTANYNQIFEIAKKEGIKQIYKNIRQIEEQDYSANKYPRFKKSDDASAVYFENSEK